MSIRSEIGDIVLERDPDSTIPYKPLSEYYPHITIGYVGGDVHVDENGDPISKGSDTCAQYIKFY